MAANYVIYRGIFFTVEWYFDDSGKSKVQRYFNDLPDEQKKKVLRLFRLLADMGKIHNEEKFRYEGNQIYVFKPSPDRFLCFFFEGARVIVTNAYEKKTDKMPDREKVAALKAKANYVERFRKGKYYV